MVVRATLQRPSARLRSHDRRRCARVGALPPRLRLPGPGCGGCGVAERALTYPCSPHVLQLVEQHGCKKWALIASKMPNKGSKQCRRRWQNYLNNADAKQGGWSADEARARAKPPPGPS